MMTVRWVHDTILAILLIVFAVIAGCDSPQKTQDTLAVLERGHFRGQVAGGVSRPPLSARMVNEWSLGSELSLTFDGEVDFSRPLLREPGGLP